VLEVDGVTRYIRLKDEETRNKWARVPGDFRELISPSEKAAAEEAAPATQAEATQAKAKTS